MAQAIPVAWKCSECSLEYESEEEAVECCDTDPEAQVSEDAAVEGEGQDESDDD